MDTSIKHAERVLQMLEGAKTTNNHEKNYCIGFIQIGIRDFNKPEIQYQGVPGVPNGNATRQEYLNLAVKRAEEFLHSLIRNRDLTDII